MKKIFYFLGILMAFQTNAQVLSYDFYSFKINNMFNVNPAFTGRNDGLNLVLSAQTQNRGVSYSNKNFMVGVHSKISKKQALGIKLVSDSRGAFQVLKADLCYSYFAKISEDMDFTLGLSAGILNNSLMLNRIDNFQSLDQSDPTLTKSYYNTNQFAAGTGILYRYKDLDVSFSMPHVITTNQQVNGYIHAAAFYTIKAGEQFKIRPWICYQNIPFTKDQASLFVKAIYKELVWVQAGYQSNKSICTMFGINIENLNIGYGYKISNSLFSAVTSGLHEITFGFKIKETHHDAGHNSIEHVF